ncbi:MAG: phosphonate C-P lyase system protein PhnH [Desulfitobacteriaceae bacterium]
MKLNLVHDLQAAYRKTVDSMSRPGLINSIRDQADKVSMEIDCFDSTLIMVLMLFDTETKFKVCSEYEAEITKLINQLTYAKATEAESAAFILLLNDAKPEDMERALRMASIGDLLNPHKSATIIVEADSLSNDRELILTGPGIAGESYVKVQTTSNWVDIRTEKNSEYPLGIDLILTDQNANILCLPRTTQITKQVVG